MPEIQTAGSPGAANGTPGAIVPQTPPPPPEVKSAHGRIVSQTTQMLVKNDGERRVTYFSLDNDPARTYAAFGYTSFDEDEIPTGSEVEIAYTDWPGTDKWGRPITFHNLRRRPYVVPQPQVSGYPEIDRAFGPEPAHAAATPAPPPYRTVDKDNEVELTCSCLRKAKRHLDALRLSGTPITDTDAGNMETWLDKLGLMVDGLRAVPAH